VDQTRGAGTFIGVPRDPPQGGKRVKETNSLEKVEIERMIQRPPSGAALLGAQTERIRELVRRRGLKCHKQIPVVEKRAVNGGGCGGGPRGGP